MAFGHNVCERCGIDRDIMPCRCEREEIYRGNRINKLEREVEELKKLTNKLKS